MSKRRDRREADVSRRTFPYESRLECARSHVSGLEGTLRRLRRDAAGRGADATREELRRLLVRARIARDDLMAARQDLGWQSTVGVLLPTQWPMHVFHAWGLLLVRARLRALMRHIPGLRARREVPTRAT